VLTALTRLYMVRADRAATETFFEQQRQLLLHVQTPADAIMLHTQMGTVELMRGAHARSQEHHTQVLELYEAPKHWSLLLMFGIDPKSIALATLGWSLCLSGWPERAWSWEQRALEHAEELYFTRGRIALLQKAESVGVRASPKPSDGESAFGLSTERWRF